MLGLWKSRSGAEKENHRGKGKNAVNRETFIEVATQIFLMAPETAEQYADEAENNGRTYEAVLGFFAEMVAKNRKREITNYKFLRHSCGETHMEKQNYSISAISKLFEGVDGHDLRLTVKGLDLCDVCTNGLFCRLFFNPCGGKLVYSKLAQYEDSGLTPEQAQKIGKEEK